MNKVLIIADDLTGANANCALMKSIGLTAASITDYNIDQLPKEMDVIAITTDSRAMDSISSYRRVKSRVIKYKSKDIKIYAKRIDSTLRGNLGAELKGYQDSFDEHRLAICVPAYPDSNRIVVNNYMYVDGVPLMNTDAGKDSKISAVSNFVSDNFRKDYNGEIVNISIEDISLGLDHVVDLINRNKDKDLLIFDSITNKQIQLIAKAVIKSKIKYISVDPGPFTKELTKAVYEISKINTKAIAIIGSVTNITIKQMKELNKNFDCYKININPLNLIEVDKALKEINKAINLVLEKLKKYKLIILTTTPENVSDRLDLKKISSEKNISVDDLSLMISRGLAKIGKEIVSREKSVSGLFTSGGDVTVAVSEELSSDGIEIREEIQPLVAYGRLIGGEKPGLKIVSKGGMVGNDRVMVECINRLLNGGD